MGASRVEGLVTCCLSPASLSQVCCLELGVSLLHGGDNYFQKAFLLNFEKKVLYLSYTHTLSLSLRRLVASFA